MNYVSFIGVEFSSVYLLFNALYKKKKVLVEAETFVDGCEHFSSSVYSRAYWEAMKFCPMCLKSTEQVRVPEKYKKVYKLRSFVSNRNDFDRVVENSESSSDFYAVFLLKIFENDSLIWFYDGRTNTHFSLDVYSNTHLWFKKYTNVEECHEVQGYVESLNLSQIGSYLSHSVVVGSGSKDFSKMMSDSMIDNILYQCRDLNEELKELQRYRLMKYLFSNESGFGLESKFEVKGHQLREFD